MSQLIHAARIILNQLADAIKQLSDDEFIAPSPTLGGSSIGQHLRHTLEFFICLEQGIAEGVINYDKRGHDKLIETDRDLAFEVINRIDSFVGKQAQDRNLTLEASYGEREVVSVDTSYFRELTYNIEHAVHHMAIMKIGIREIAPKVCLPDDFGVAASTVRYREAQLAVEN
ncbi:MAG TPA: hypothetical protein VL728_00780 [Cyclobacteriaceae bacterium]|jgi:uncharacterized damage-inducible protein DinB|nr:hypothetical protein [Cyclobacteriaceae bacterium]